MGRRHLTLVAVLAGMAVYFVLFYAARLPSLEGITGGVFRRAGYFGYLLHPEWLVSTWFGNAGQFAALLGEKILGLKLVAASDSRGGVYNPQGIDAAALVEHKIKTGRVNGFPDAEEISNEALLEMEVTVLFPSALENVITEANAGKLRCRIMCELANGPTTPEADEILYDKGTIVLPDFLANAGGVTVSYLEQVQNTYNLYWKLEEVHWRLEEKMTRAFQSVHEMHQLRKVNMRQAAYLVSVARVAEACKLRGWV